MNKFFTEKYAKASAKKAAKTQRKPTLSQAKIEAPASEEEIEVNPDRR